MKKKTVKKLTDFYFVTAPGIGPTAVEKLKADMEKLITNKDFGFATNYPLNIQVLSPYESTVYVLSASGLGDKDTKTLTKAFNAAMKRGENVFVTNYDCSIQVLQVE